MAAKSTLCFFLVAGLVLPELVRAQERPIVIRMQDKIGTLAPGMDADIIGVDGNPVDDITAFRRVVFVMKSGKVYKNVAPDPK